ncbi:hypothetical protein M409DRAFT_22245 [Zasmidium cellare ATCC 36951]|uniref:Uncharacterized protein n=1 Tax=Zasmidium cellare ATCC 36951 TaxID=1080233 RepID=A0A6A6CPP2_ZASCE|nr:uncharacterized protein M409DRAFT_22245 [Zasmidium cellare ATCC 36951]KAF2167436.1 hypothetical protein M409DRAFT_22245 [Zasmidium cellare ATCC 36951]
MLRLGLDLPGPVTRTTLTQPIFCSDLMMLWPSEPLTEAIQIAGVTTKREVEKVVARVNVIPTNLGQWLAVARALAAHESSLDDWVRKFAGRPLAKIEVAKTVFPPHVQDVLCGNVTYTHSWNGPGT